MTDVEWIAQVRKYALQFGRYTFSQEERRRMLPYVRGKSVEALHCARHCSNWIVQLPSVFDLMDDMERGITDAVAAKLTQGQKK